MHIKKTMLIFLIVTIRTSSINAQAIDTTILKKIMDKGNKQIVSAITNLPKVLKDTLSNSNYKENIQHVKPSELITDLLTFLPVILFLIILLIIVIKLKKDNVKLSDFLTDKETQLAIKKEDSNVLIANANVNIAAANAIKANAQAFIVANTSPPEIPTSSALNPKDPESNINKDQSTSRLIAFISGLVSVALAVCITSFYFYRSFLGDTNTSIGDIAKVLYGLGIGVLPYGFSKIASAIK